MRKTLCLVGVLVVSSAMTVGQVIASQSTGGQSEKAKEGSQAAAKKPHTMTGCLEKGSEENRFRLTNIEGTGPKTAELHADASLKLSGHVGHQVAITGTDIDPKTLKKGTTGTAGGAAAPASKDAAGAHHMRVQSMKHLSGTCS